MDNVISEPLFRRVAIVGLGLLGGSWGLALKKAGFAGRVVGYARRAETRQQALGEGAVDEGFADVNEAVHAADLVILATPVAVILDHLPRLQPQLVAAGAYHRCRQYQAADLPAGGGTLYPGTAVPGWAPDGGKGALGTCER